MKSILSFAYGTLLVLVFSASHAQEARIMRVHIYENEKDIVYMNESFYINQDNSPVHIKNVRVQHIPGKTAALAEAYYDGLFRYLEEHDKNRLRKLARETLTITIDAEGQGVVAVKFGVIVYDAFKEFLGGLTGVTMDPPTFGMKWDYNPIYLFKFEKYGVVGVYVRQARLEDGRIWNFDENLITSKFSDKLGDITREQIVGSDS